MTTRQAGSILSEEKEEDTTEEGGRGSDPFTGMELPAGANSRFQIEESIIGSPGNLDLVRIITLIRTKSKGNFDTFDKVYNKSLHRNRKKKKSVRCGHQRRKMHKKWHTKKEVQEVQEDGTQRQRN